MIPTLVDESTKKLKVQEKQFPHINRTCIGVAFRNLIAPLSHSKHRSS